MELTTENSLDRAPWIDALRIIAAILVVVVHVSTPYFEQDSPSYSSLTWLIASLYASVARICVPLFFMITGYLSFRRDIDPVSFWRRRISRIVVPWLFWSAVYLCHRIWHDGNEISLYSAARLMLVNDVYYHMWFLYSLFWIYTAIPFATAVLRFQPQILRFAAVGLWVSNEVILPSVGTALTRHTKLNCHFAVETPVFSGYLGFVLLGYLIGQMNTTQMRTVMFTLFSVLGVIMTFLLTVKASVLAGVGTQAWFSYFSPGVVMASCGVFYIARFLSPHSDHYAIRSLARMTFGVYLVHPLILDLATPAFEACFPNSSILAIPLITVTTLLCSFAVVYFMTYLPVMRRTVIY